MKQTRRNLFQAATIVCTFLIVFTMVWKPVAEAQRDTNKAPAKERIGKFEIEDTGSGDVSVLDVCRSQ